MIREIQQEDLHNLLKLYCFLHEETIPSDSPRLENTWNNILADQNHHIIVAEEENQIVSSCVCIIIPNLSRNISPYALIENVVTHDSYRRKGLATQCLNYAKELAKSNGCYKIMLLTSHKEKSMLDFYRKAGYNSEDKTAFIQWI